MSNVRYYRCHSIIKTERDRGSRTMTIITLIHVKIIVPRKNGKMARKIFNVFKLAHFAFCPSLLVRVPLLALPEVGRARHLNKLCTPPWRHTSPGRFCQNGRVPQQRNNRTDSSTTPQRRTQDARHADSAARGRPRRSPPRPGACSVGQNLTIAKHTDQHGTTTRRTRARRWASPGSSAEPSAAPIRACVTAEGPNNFNMATPKASR